MYTQCYPCTRSFCHQLFCSVDEGLCCIAYEKDVDLYEDVPLDYDDIQLLSSRDGVAAFFSMLHYNTDERVEQTIAAMGFTAESLRSAIKYIERIAYHQDFDSF